MRSIVSLLFFIRRKVGLWYSQTLTSPAEDVLVCLEHVSYIGVVLFKMIVSYYISTLVCIATFCYSNGQNPAFDYDLLHFEHKAKLRSYKNNMPFSHLT